MVFGQRQGRLERPFRELRDELRRIEAAGNVVSGGALVVDKSSAYRLVDGYPLVVPEVNGARALEAIETTRVVANPNCCTIPLTCVLKPLHDAAGLRRVRVSTYQSVSGAGAQRMEQLRNERPEEHNLVMDWSWEGDETDEESKLRAETRKILELPNLPLSATTVRVPVFRGHSESVNIETEKKLSADEARAVLSAAPGVLVYDAPEKNIYPIPLYAAGKDETFVGRIREDESIENGLNLWLVSDNLRKGAALNAVQIAEKLVAMA